RLALVWLLRGGGQDLGPADWVIQDGDSPKTAFGRARDWFRLAQLNFQRLYPWVLFGPYAIWIASTFLLERGRLLVSCPVHALAGIASAAASQAINSLPKLSVARVVIVNSEQEDSPGK